MPVIRMTSTSKPGSLQRNLDRRIRQTRQLIAVHTAMLAFDGRTMMIDKINAHKAATAAAHPEYKKRGGNQLALHIKVNPSTPDIYMQVGAFGDILHSIFYELGTGPEGAASPTPPKKAVGAGGYSGAKGNWQGMKARPYAEPTAGFIALQWPGIVKTTVRQGMK